ncbi:unnamed protein product [Brassica oleracea]
MTLLDSAQPQQKTPDRAVITTTRKSSSQVIGEEASITEKVVNELQLLTEDEINQLADQYASVDFEMDEDLLEEDDLLDDMMDEDTVIPETQGINSQAGGDQNKEGISQGVDGKEKEKSGRINPEAGQEMDKKKRSQKDKPPPKITIKHRGVRSPDTKGIAASKKLANRGRASPKGKQVKQGRLHTRVSSSTVVPRIEVYPSATKGRKSSTVSGLMGSQKPPSTHI